MSGYWYVLKIFIIFYWSIVDLQCSANLCCTAKWFSYIRIDTLFYILFHYGLSQDIEYSSLGYIPAPQGLELTEILRLKNTLLYAQRGRKQHVCPAFVPPKCLCAKARRGSLGWGQGSRAGRRSESHLVTCVTAKVTLDWCSLHPEF